jgi:hypothetical protein
MRGKHLIGLIVVVAMLPVPAIALAALARCDVEFTATR